MPSDQIIPLSKKFVRLSTSDLKPEPAWTTLADALKEHRASFEQLDALVKGLPQAPYCRPHRFWQAWHGAVISELNDYDELTEPTYLGADTNCIFGTSAVLHPDAPGHLVQTQWITPLVDDWIASLEPKILFGQLPPNPYSEFDLFLADDVRVQVRCFVNLDVLGAQMQIRCSVSRVWELVRTSTIETPTQWQGMLISQIN